MSPSDEAKYDDQFLVRYLLGVLPPEDIERLDELSIVDDDFATRLSAVENDLVDAYANKELSAAEAERFTSSYLSSPRRRQKLEFAKSLLGFTPVARTETAETPATPAPEAPAVPVTQRPRKRFGLGWGTKLAFAGMSLALLLIAGYFSRENVKLRRTISSGAGRQESLLSNQQRLEQELAQQRSANADLQGQLDQAHSQPNLETLTAVSLLLPPPTRGAGRPPTITLPGGTNLAVLLLTIDANDFPQYRAALKDPATDHVLWTSGNLRAAALGDKSVVSISFPANLLKQQNYVVELTGLPTRGAPENMGSYSFRAVLK